MHLAQVVSPSSQKLAIVLLTSAHSKLGLQFHGGHDHSRLILFHWLQNLHHLRRHQCVHLPRRL